MGIGANEAQEEDGSRCTFVHPDGARCEFRGTANAVGTHMRNSHGLRDPARAFTVLKQCPLCRRIYKNARDAAGHVARATWEGRCPPAVNSPKHVPRLHQ